MGASKGLCHINCAAACLPARFGSVNVETRQHIQSVRPTALRGDDARDARGGGGHGRGNDLTMAGRVAVDALLGSLEQDFVTLPDMAAKSNQVCVHACVCVCVRACVRV
jgi:hypothetical protein